MKIAILGTRGIPNNYGGFEQITEWLSVGLAEKGHDVYVYNSHNHPNQEKEWKSVKIIHCYDPEYFLKTAGQFVYDLNCIRDARKNKFDVLLFMGYTSSSVWHAFFPSKTVIISNMDGFEWKRSKYSKPVRRFLKYAESLAIKHSDHHIADSKPVQAYLKQNYNTESIYIPYGPGQQTCEPGNDPGYGLKNDEYFLLMARMEPENNIEMILEGFMLANVEKIFVVVGNTETALGKKLTKKYKDHRILFTGGIFQPGAVESLRRNASLYFHGHSVGGTNPSLLEAMNSSVCIAAHRNPFNEAVLGNDGLYFSTSLEVSTIIQNEAYTNKEKMVTNNLKKLDDEFSREKVIAQYEKLITTCIEK
jgi:glycosyltransferase involved in cell wall biosynthesis